MFDIGFSELVVIGLIALIVLGPQRLPEVARTAGRWVGKARRFVESVKRDIDQEINSEDLAAFKDMRNELSETRSLLQKSADDTLTSLSRVKDDMGSVVTDVHDAAAAGLPAPALDAPETSPVTTPARKIAAKKPAAKKTTGKKPAIKKTAVKKAVAAKKPAKKKPAASSSRGPRGGKASKR